MVDETVALSEVWMVYRTVAYLEIEKVAAKAEWTAYDEVACSAVGRDIYLVAKTVDVMVLKTAEEMVARKDDRTGANMVVVTDLLMVG